MRNRIIRRARFAVIEPGQVATAISPEPFLFPAGHRNRAANCLICGTAIGGHPAAIVVVAAVSADACPCGGVVSDSFLLHAFHLPMQPGEMQAALHRGLHCSATNHR